MVLWRSGVMARPCCLGLWSLCCRRTGPIPARLVISVCRGGSCSRLELVTGLEPVTSSLPRRCSTTELRQLGSRASRGDTPRARHWVCLFLTHARDGSPLRLPTADTSANALGAGEGNRTLVSSLEGYRSTIELRPLGTPRLPRVNPEDERQAADVRLGRARGGLRAPDRRETPRLYGSPGEAPTFCARAWASSPAEGSPLSHQFAAPRRPTPPGAWAPPSFCGSRSGYRS